MLLYNARKSSSGFTLIEMLVTITVVGVIAAIAAPNFLGMLNRNRVNNAAQQVEGALKEAQRQAMRRGKPCSFNVNTTNSTISGGCLLSNRELNTNSYTIQLNSNTTTITFSGKGNITGTPSPVLVVSIPNGTNLQRCVVIDSLLGSLRSGDYSGTIPTTPVSTSCQ
ncbi:MAG TPA: GspH/FimT family pseudopilin [Coleofasciculaceae cyanobacterium]|jgi:prepilin-type N-terminal cleavage/methylation domain-containing protein